MTAEEKKIVNAHTSVKEGLESLASNFQCPVCGAIFTTDEDRKQHMKKESHGELHEGTTQNEMEMAKEQEELNEPLSSFMKKDCQLYSLQLPHIIK